MEDLLEKRLRELADRSWTRGIPCFTDFLDLREQTVLQNLRRSLSQPEMLLFGGAEGCERVMAGFGLSPGEEDRFPLACLRITPLGMKFAGEMSHRDVLGALMSLGFERSLLGDIVLREKEAWVFCADRIAPYIQDRLSAIRRTPVRTFLTQAPPEGELFRTRRETLQVSAPRADALAAHAFRLSRGEAQKLFAAGKVFLDGAECLRPDALPREGQILSLRGVGRFRYVGAASQSKKGKWNVLIDRYI